MSQTAATLLGGFVGLAFAGIWVWARSRLGRPRTRVSVTGNQVPVVLGEAWVAGSLAGLACLLALRAAGVVATLGATPITLALLIVLIALWGAGRWDDARGDERPRGFGGHLAAARSGHLTGGLVKLGAGAVAALVAASLVSSGWAAVETALLIALAANFINLCDRAPGRAAKAAMIVAVPLVAFAEGAWRLHLAPSLGALLATTPADLRGRGMLGDEGANPLGALLGLGLALSLSEPWRLAAVLVLALLNAASERWSFSDVIEQTRWLRTFDRLGRE